MTDDEERERRRDIIYKAHDALAEAREFNDRFATYEASRDLSQPDPFAERQQRLRDEQPKQRPKPNDTAAARAAYEATWNNWCDGRIRAAVDQYHEMIMEVVAYALGTRCRGLLNDIAALRRELDDARSEIKMLQRSKAAAITGSVPDLKNYRVQLTMSDGRPGPMLNLRPIFERFHQEAQF